MNRSTGQVVDSKIVELVFNNESFEKNAATSLKTLDKLKGSLNFDGATKGFDNIDKAAKKVSFVSIHSGLDALERRFSTFGIVGATIITDITRKVEGLIGNTLSKVTSLPRNAWNIITQGGKKRAFGIENSRFMLQGLFPDDLEEVERIMADAMDSVDGTAYAFDSAAQAASQFAASGLKSGEQLQKAMKGITGVAAMTNSEYESISQIFTTVAGNGRLMGDQLLQLSSRGLNAASTMAQFFNDIKNGSENVANVSEEVKKKVKELAKTTTVTEADIRDFVSKSKISFDIFSEAMSSAFGEHAKKANKTFEGSFANMQAALKKIGAKFYTPLIEQEGPLVDLFNATREKINEINRAIDPLVNSLSGGVIKGIETITNLVKSFDFQNSGFKQFFDSFSLTNKVSQKDWDKFANAGFASDAYLKNLRKRATEHGIVIAKILSDEEWLNYALDHQMLTISDLKDAFTGFTTMETGAIKVNESLKKSIEEKMGEQGMQEYFTKIEELSKKYSRKDLMSIVFGNGAYEEGAKDLEETLDSMLKYLGLSQESGEDLKGVLMSMGHFAESTTKDLTEMSREELRQLGYSGKQIRRIRELANEGKNADEIFKDLGIDTMSGGDHFINAIGNITSTFTSLLGMIGDGWAAIFPDTESGTFFKFLKGFDDATTKIREFVENSDKLPNVFSGVAAVFDIAVQGVTGFGKGLMSIGGGLLKGLNIDLVGLASGVSDVVQNFRNWITNSNLIESVTTNLGKVFTGVGTVVREWLDSFTQIPVVKQNIERFRGAFKTFFSNVGGFVLKGRDKFDGFIKKVEGLDGVHLDNFMDVLGMLKEGFLEYISEFKGFDTLKTAFSDAWNSIVEAAKGYGVDLSFVTNGFNFMKNAAMKAFNSIKTTGGKAFKNITTFGSAFSKTFLKSVGGIQEKFTPFLDSAKQKVSDFLANVTNLGGFKFSNIAEIFRSLRSTIIGYFSDNDIFGTIKESFSNFWENVRTELSASDTDLNWLVDIFEGFGKAASGTFKVVTDAAVAGSSAIGKLFDKVKNSTIVQNALQRFGKAFDTIWNNGGEFVQELWVKVRTFASDLGANGGVTFENIKSFGQMLLDSLVNFEGFQDLGDAIDGLWGDVKVSLGNVGIDVDAVAQGISDVIEKVWETIKGLEWPDELSEIPVFIDDIVRSVQDFTLPETFTKLFGKIDEAKGSAEEVLVGIGAPAEDPNKEVTIFDTVKMIFGKIVDLASWAKDHLAIVLAGAIVFKGFKSIISTISTIKDLLDEKVSSMKATNFEKRGLGLLAIAGAIWVVVDAVNKIQNMLLNDTDESALDEAIGKFGRIIAMLAGLVALLSFKGELNLGVAKVGYESSAAAIWGVVGIVAAIGLVLGGLLAEETLFDFDGSRLDKIVDNVTTVINWIAGLTVVLGLFGPGIITSLATQLPLIIGSLSAIAPQITSLVATVVIIAMVIGVLDESLSAFTGGKYTVSGIVSKGFEAIGDILSTISEGIGKILGALVSGAFEQNLQGLSDSLNNIKNIVDTAKGDGISTLKFSDFNGLANAVAALLLITTAIDFVGLIQALPSAGFQILMGKTAVEALAKDIEDLAGAIAKWNEILPEEGDELLKVDAAGLDTLSGEIAKINGEGLSKAIDQVVKNWIDPEDKTFVQSWADDLEALALALLKWNIIMGYAGDIVIDGAAITAITEAVNNITKTGGLIEGFKNFVFGETDSEAFTTNVGYLATALNAFNNELDEGVDTAKLSLASKALNSLASIAYNMAGVTDAFTTVKWFSGALTGKDGFASALNSFVAEVGDNIDEVIKLGDATSKLSGVFVSLNTIFKGDIMDDEQVTAFETNVTKIVGVIDGLDSLKTSGVSKFTGALSDIGDAAVPDLSDTADKIAEQGSKATSEMASNMDSSAVTTAMSGVMDDALNTVKGVRGFTTAGFEIVEQIARGISSNRDAETAIGMVASGAASTLGGYYGSFYDSGAYVTLGFSSGIYSQMLQVMAAAQAIAQAAVNKIKTIIKQGSPAKVTIESGNFFGEGFAIGIANQVANVESASESIGEAAKRGLNTAISGINAALTGDIDAAPVIRPVLDLSEIQNGAGNIAGLLTAMGPIDPFGNFGAIGSAVDARRQAASLEDVVSALGQVERSTSNIRGGDTYNVNGITYDDGSNITDAIRVLTHAVLTERRR